MLSKENKLPNNNEAYSISEPNNFSKHLDEIIHKEMQKEASESDDD